MNARAVYGVSSLHYVGKRGHRECAEVNVLEGEPRLLLLTALVFFETDPCPCWRGGGCA